MATTLEDALDEAEKLSLKKHPVWLKLLHYDLNESSSSIITDNFFLSEDGRHNSEAELITTINAFFSPWKENADEHARCRFPARYFWLSRFLDLPLENYRREKCQQLEKWALFDNVQSISLLLVSGYFGNPASTFGHALLKFNTDLESDKSGLFDLTLNYGAMVPENENSILYVVRGLFGGYTAGFSDKYFYTEDLVYSRTEFRDIWDYRLALSDYERTLLVLHIWELIGKKFKYYFLDKNCAYRIAELIDLVIEEEVITNARLWYFPEELFHKLNDIDYSRKSINNKRKIIQSIRFIPSSQRELFHQVRQLSAGELEIFNAILRDGISSMPIHFADTSNENKTLILDGLLAYQQYRLISQEPTPDPELQKAKDQILLTRLLLPSRLRERIEIPELPSPAEGTRPMAFNIGFATERDHDSYLRFAWSPFKKELVGVNSLEGDEFVLLDVAVGLFKRENKIFIDRLDLVKILNLNILTIPVENESHLSWRFRAGVDRVKDDELSKYDGVLSFGIGRAAKWNELFTGYGIIDFAAHSIKPFIRFRPHVGLIIQHSDLKTWISGGAESTDYNLEFRGIWGGKVQYQLTNSINFYSEISNEEEAFFSAGVIFYIL